MAAVFRFSLQSIQLSLIIIMISTLVNALATPRRALPSKLLIGYGIHPEKVRTAVNDGVNVVIWAFMNIVASCDGTLEEESKRSLKYKEGGELTQTTTKGKMQSDLDLDAIHKLIQELDASGYDHVVHLVSFGGWNGPHLSTELTADEWYTTWKESRAGAMFHGIDWDLEGNDDLQSPYNVFTVECLEKMGHISQYMKQDGYLVGMAPPQSYMNFDNPHFSRYVNLTEPERPWHSEFHYFGANVYSYLLAKYGDSIDFVSMQLYESYSLAAMAVFHDQMTPPDYLVSYIQDLIIKQQSKFYVNFALDPDLNMKGQHVELPLEKVVIGLANGWAADPENKKHVYITPGQCQQAYEKLKASSHGDLTPRGFMFWTIEEEGTRDVHLARDLSKVLHID